MLCSLSIWTLSDAMQAKGLSKESFSLKVHSFKIVTLCFVHGADIITMFLISQISQIWLIVSSFDCHGNYVKSYVAFVIVHSHCFHLLSVLFYSVGI